MRAQARSFDLHRNVLITRGKVVRIEERHRAVLHVEHGAVWITQRDSRDDVVLEAGDSFRIAPKRGTLASTCGGFCMPFALVNIELNMPRELPLHSRITEGIQHWWAGLRLGTTSRWHL